MGQEKLWLLHVTLAAVLCLTYPSLCADPVVRGRVGGTAELGCSLPSLTDEVTTPNQLPLHVVEWVRLGYNVPILIKFGGYTPRVHPDYKGRVFLIRGASLVVDGLTLEDEGWFECRILLLDRTTDEFRNGTWTFLSITAPPVFIKMPPAFVEVLLGESLTLSCVAHGNPKPSITWTKDDNTVEEQDKIQVINGTLSLVKVTRETAGMYKCHVSNSGGNLTHVTQLQVKGPPVIINPPKNSTFNMSQDATLQCHADAYPSNLTYEWRKEEQNVYHVESLKSRVKILVDGTLLITDLIPEDSGNYTCIPTNGLLTPPSASAYLKVKHPARVVRMPRETYLPTGMGGTIVCPVQAEPPMLFVNWTKDGKLLDLRQYPGWTVNSGGSVFISTVNDNAVGMYTCTAYNSYGTMGQSEPTKVILKDPPSFRVAPRSEYLQEVGRELMIPCQAQGDPSPNITWTKIGSKPHSLYNVLSNGSLVLQPLSKDHQGAWKCHATNSVATVSKGTIVLVLGTSPHAATAVFVDPGINHANVSWKPGFDGGYTQTFTVWVKSTTKGKHEWASIPVPSSKSSLLVPGLQATTSYQFSVLPQNKLGSGPFSEIVTMRTLALPTDPPTENTNLATPAAPTLLSVNYTAAGVLLQWLPPPAESPPITAFMLQAKQEKEDWITLNEAIDVNVTSIIVLGLTRDSSYELRLLSQRDGLVSEPSESVNVSTIGMVMYPAPASLLTFVSEPLTAGVIAGVCFLFVAIILSVVAAYVMNHRREQRRRKRRDDIQSAFQKPQSPQAFLPNNSPDSLLKMKLCPPLNFFPNSSSSDRSDRSSFDRGSRSEYQDQKKQLLSSSPPLPCYTVFESHLGSSQSPTSAIDSISRGPDGRFNAQPYSEGCIPTCITKNQDKGSNSGSFRDSPKSCSDMSEKEVIQEPSTGLTVNSVDFERPAQSNRVKSMSSTLSQHGCFYSDKDQSCSENLKKASFHSDRQDNGTCSQLTEPSTMVSQLEHEQGLMKESEGSYTITQTAQECENTQERAKSASPVRSWSGAELEDPVWKPQDIQLRQKNKRPSSLAHRRGCYFGNTSSPMDRQLSSSSSHVQWDISPVISPTSQVPFLGLSDGSTPRCLQPDTTQEDLISVEAAEDLKSSVTQYTSVSILSHSRDVSALYGSDLNKTQAKCPERPKDREQESFASSTGADKYLRQDTKTGTQPNDSTSICPAPCTPQASEMASEKIQHYGEEREQETSPKLDTYTSHSISGCPTILYNQKRERERKTDEPSSSFLHPEEEKECVRSRSRKSDKCALSSSPTRISPLTLLENESESNKSDSSMIRLSESLKAKFVPQPARISSLQTSTILEYLSLPGFVEMSVDEPTEESQKEQESSSPGTEPENKTLLRGEPDVVPKNWETHGQERSGVMPSIPVVQNPIDESQIRVDRPQCSRSLQGAHCHIERHSGRSSTIPPPGEIQREFHGMVGIGKASRDIKSAGDDGRASYASQSSGRGSVGPYGHGHLRQSLSITPTLISSPETTEETERHRRESGLREKRLKR
ncbi:protein turtle homolog A [Trichomycterus rosablanca]|uniref:protein turtle homolog A n=1 Tax=Trichomycterus rosablanca TaxID=2290929 RepID=UPI002F34F940